jgi:glycosyltransferase involved in cell wall biosynthesis
MDKLDNKRVKSGEMHKRKRIAHIFNHANFIGGGEISFFELIRMINKNSYQPIVIVPNAGEIEQKLNSINITTQTLRFPSLKGIMKFTPFKAIFNLIKFLKRNKINIIHANGSRVCFYASIAGKVLGIPTIWHVRETVKDLYWYDCILGILSSKIICVSKSVQRDRFTRYGKLINNKISIIYNGVDTKIFQKDKLSRKKIRENLGLKNQILFGIVGNFVPLKGHNYFLKGFADARSRNLDLNAKILLIGRTIDDDYYKSLIGLIEQLNIKGDIIFKPYCSKIQEILSALDVFALPSIREGFNRSILEAMSCGLPIIATKINAIEEAIINKKNGLLFDSMNINKISKAIIKVYRNEAMRYEMGMCNRLTVDKNFNLFSHVKDIELFYSKIV